MDFVRVLTKVPKNEKNPVEVYPDFEVHRSTDLMVQGGAFYAIWDEKKGLWSRDEYDLRALVDEKVLEKVRELEEDGVQCTAKTLRSFDTNRWNKFKAFAKSLSDNSHPLDTKVTFANTEVKKRDYASRRLSYSLGEGSIQAYDELVSLLYEPKERQKFEWMIGSIIAGDSKKIQKFLVFYGGPGTGKSTVMDITADLFGGLVKKGGYVALFDAKALVGNNNSFATSAFKDNPLVAIQHDGDLSKIEDNSKLNSIVSHEDMQINEKYKATYDSRINAVLFMGTNKPVKITDAKSGLIRRLIDVHPTGKTHSHERYIYLMEQVKFEYGAIAQHCLDVYKSLGKSYYNKYVPTDMMNKTDFFYNFVEAYFDVFKAQDGVSLRQAFTMFKEYTEESDLGFKIAMYKFREALKDYFDEFLDRTIIDGVVIRSYFQGFKTSKFEAPEKEPEIGKPVLVLEETESILDGMLADLPAQYGNAQENPKLYWDDSERMDKDGKAFIPKPSQVVSTTLKDLDTSKLHFVKVPENHIVIDFDLTGKDGKKSLERNLEAAASWPHTYAELSKGGAGVHLHYIYDGNPNDLASEYEEGIEIKVYTGNSSLRRRLSKCNNAEVATISSGLPIKEKKPVLETTTLKTERGLRSMIQKNLEKEFLGYTKPSIDFIDKLLNDAYNSGMAYDVTDMRQKLMYFANQSSNQPLECLRVVRKMKFKSEDEVIESVSVDTAPVKDERVVLFDVEVYPNLFVICWMYEDGENAGDVVKMINPTPQQVEGLFQFKLVGFNNRKYDNHILWGRYMGMNNEQLYQLSQRIIDNDRDACYAQAYNLSYTDIYDFASEKKGLKKWGIELGMHHMEMDIPWDQPVPDDKIEKVVEYCTNDVLLTKATWLHRKQDFAARQILAELSGLTVNDTTNKHSLRILFGDNRNPQKDFVYTDLSEMFPGYKFDEYAKVEKSTYRGESVGEGGYVYAEPGIYENVALLDVASMHPTSIKQLDLFGPYTKKFVELMDARLAIKHGDFEAAKKFFDGKLTPYIEEIERIEDPKERKKAQKNLEYSQKIVINSVYGLTSAKFDNPARDIRNKDNIVAKRGALFMVDLKHFIQERLGKQVVHIKTDSVKIPNATEEDIQLIQKFGQKYGYEFEHEATYDKFCLVNDAVYIARQDEPTLSGIETKWTAVGAQFQHPFVYKTLFTGVRVTFEDLCEAKSVAQGSMYLDFGAEKATPTQPYKGMHFVGRTGLFVPVTQESGGGTLVRVKDDKPFAVTGTKGYYWAEAEMVKEINKIDAPFFDITMVNDTKGFVVDMSYFEKLAEKARDTIEEYGSYADFIA